MAASGRNIWNGVSVSQARKVAGLRLLNGCPKTCGRRKKSQARAGAPDTGAEAKTMESPAFGLLPKRLTFSVEKAFMGTGREAGFPWLPLKCDTLATQPAQSLAHHRQLAHGPWEHCLQAGLSGFGPWRLGDTPASVVLERPTE